ncbi:MAG: hypothetical protein ACJ76N_29165, partial [Thermoanaerobaculia bacterium]
MPPAPKTPAPHVQAALRRTSHGPARPPAAQPARPAVAHGAPAPHVQAAMARTAPAVQARPA